MKKTLPELAVLFASILLMGILGAVYSLVFAGVAGWATIGVNPSFGFGLVERYVCPPGAHLRYAAGPATGSQAGSAGNSINCIAPDGSSQPAPYGRAVFAVNVMFFLMCFVPTFIPGAILMWLSVQRWVQRASETDNDPPDLDEE